MANLEDEIRDLREQNSELAQEAQFWKMTAGQKEKEKLDLMKEVNELRLKLSVLRSNGAAQARKLDTALQSASEEALSHLVQASGAVARTIELTKQYIQEREEMESVSPRFSSIGGAPESRNTDKVNRVPPLLIGGQSIQPVVALSRTILNNRSMTRSPNPNSASGVTHRVLPMHILQDVSIPLTRIDLGDLQMNAAEEDPDSADDLGLEESSDQVADENVTSIGEVDESLGRLDAVLEDEEHETEEEIQTEPRILTTDNPLEGPSWLLDVVHVRHHPRREKVNLEPDSTTPCELRRQSPPHSPTLTPTANPPQNLPTPTPPQLLGPPTPDDAEKENTPCQSLAFTPTVRRRKRKPPSPPPPPPRPSFSPRPRKDSNSGRILKVVVAKMRFSDEDGAINSSPPKRQAFTTPVKSPRRTTIEVDPSPQRSTLDHSQRSMVDCLPRRSVNDRSPVRKGGRERDGARKTEKDRRSPSFDAPSPNGATDARVIVSESVDESRISRSVSRASERDGAREHSGSRERDSDTSAAGAEDGRTRRPRKAVSYKEKPLNRKMRR